MRIAEVAGGVHLVWLDAAEERLDDLDVVGAEQLLAHAAGLVERHIEEVQALLGNAAVDARGLGLAAADEALELLQLGRVDLPGAL